MAYTNEQLGKALEDLTTAYNNFIEKAKEAAIAAMGDTVIAQIKQDAKDHISAELAEQKAALEQAIEQAKIALKNSSDEAHVKLQQFSEEKQQYISALVEESKNALTLLAEQKFENLKTLVTAEEKKLKDLAVEMKANMEETAKEAKEKVVKEFSNISETAITETKEELKNQRIEFERKFSNQVDEFKSLSITEGNKIKKLTREKIIEWEHPYKELYQYVRLGRLNVNKPLKKIFKVKLDEENGTLFLVLNNSLSNNYNEMCILVYVCRPEDDVPLRCLSVDVPLGQTDDMLPYKNFSNYLSNDNYFSKNLICINYDEKDILKDAEGYVHLKFVVSDNNSYFFTNAYIGWFIIARRKTNLTYINVRSLNNDILEGSYDLIKENDIIYTIFNHNDIIKIPYIHANDIIVGFHLTEILTKQQKEIIEKGTIQIKGKYTDYSHPIIHRPTFKEPELPNEPPPTIKESLCNYYKLLKSQNKDEEYFYIEMKRAEVLANTEEKDSFKFLCLKIDGYYSARAFKIRGFFTDDNEEGDLYIYDKEVLPKFLKETVIHLPAKKGDSTNYKILNALTFMERGKNYTVTADFKVLNDTAAEFATILFYDFTKSEVLARSETPVVDGKCKAFLKFKYDYPVGHNVSILFYSGYCGYTQGIESEYKNFSLVEHVY